ncbi:zinc finger protein 276 [Seriola dumerili]|uniref:zinc finger protein 276 n=1 Tax=Seriola dumerili TaxID=41447 RepID=UPI000BBE1088|nr:zinc finger protein 276 [Seriola dumerili]
MKKKSRRPRSCETSRQTSRTQMTASVSEEKRTSGNRGRPRKTVPVTTDNFYHGTAATDKTVNLDFSVRAADATQKHPESKSRSSARLSTAICRLCHGKFSPRSLRHAFNRWSQDSIDIVDDESDAAAPSPLLFHTDFQQLVGVQLNRDPRLSEFICKKCHAKFYKCHSILIRFLQRVNLPPVGKENLKSRKRAKCPESSVNQGSITPPSFTSDSKCLHSLVSWAHHHGEACRSCPDLKEVLKGQCWGSVKAVWGCVDGHRYIMDTQCTTTTNPGYTMNFSSGVLGSGNGDGVMSEEDELEQEEEEDEVEQPSGNGRTPGGSISTLDQHSPPTVMAQTQSSALVDWASNTEDFTGHEEPLSPALAQLETGQLTVMCLTGSSLRMNLRRVEKEGCQTTSCSSRTQTREEELPTIYKCPYQGCTAVYRAPDGLKAATRLFMIDCYLQRHVKLIHTGEVNKGFRKRNYICDQCGQTFKQSDACSSSSLADEGIQEPTATDFPSYCTVEINARPSPLLFTQIFQQLCGPVTVTPVYRGFICKKCHAKFYKCHSILIRFLQRHHRPFTSDSKCLHSLVVSWLTTTERPAACSCPDLKESPHSHGTDSSSALVDWASNTEDFTGHEEPLSPALAQLEDRTADSDVSDRVISEDEFEESRKGGLSDDELFEPYSDKRARRVTVSNKRRRSPKAPEEPKIKKKPGPKPGWKNKFKPKGEELPNIYKCPYQGCTAVYRAPDGLKKHIKEHHEEVRERPCPHPGCNKVFMIDRYLQRHVKLIHTEERNYICDQCGQTFKQRKHLSVHQMRHSGAKPLQCEVCGFQCRQRASLKYHMTKHKAEADLEFACLICGKRFEKPHNLNVHMSMVHPLTQVEAQRGGSQQQQPYSDLHTITLTGEVVPQDQDR